MNQPIANYKKLQDLNLDMDCWCARNKKSLQCDEQGSYKQFQKFEDIKYCVDRDGFRTTIQYYHADYNCRIPGCECFSGAFPEEGCVPDMYACMDCGPDHTCKECPPCEDTECN